ncbi:MAG TPA: hypothetical protein VHB50_07840 [Bryobacteraceae bacterium]|nr:hypothetical protein [Bryobacteraceae bacterium]
MNVAGGVTYAVGDHVAVFLERMPNGYLRTTGWSQGKYRVDSAGHLRAESLLRQDAATAGTVTGASVRSLDGVTVDEFSQRVRQRISQQRRAQ